MSDLFSTLSVAARALEAQRFGLDVTGQNISNVNTPGFTRRTADLAAVPPSGSQLAGRWGGNPRRAGYSRRPDRAPLAGGHFGPRPLRRHSRHPGPG